MSYSEARTVSWLCRFKIIPPRPQAESPVPGTLGHLRRKQLLSQVAGRRKETETGLGEAGSSPSPEQLREPATSPPDMPLPPKTPALAPLEDPLLLWERTGITGFRPPRNRDKQMRRESLGEGRMEKGVGRARGSVRKGSSAKSYLRHSLARCHLGTECGLWRLQRDYELAGGLVAPRPGDPTSGSPARAPLTGAPLTVWTCSLASSADAGKPSRAGASQTPAGAPAQWPGIPGTRALCRGTRRARERAM